MWQGARYQAHHHKDHSVQDWNELPPEAVKYLPLEVCKSCSVVGEVRPQEQLDKMIWLTCPHPEILRL